MQKRERFMTSTHVLILPGTQFSRAGRISRLVFRDEFKLFYCVAETPIWFNIREYRCSFCQQF